MKIQNTKLGVQNYMTNQIMVKIIDDILIQTKALQFLAVPNFRWCAIGDSNPGPID